MLFKRKTTKSTIERDIAVKTFAYDALIEYGVDSLPVILESSNILIFSWQQYLQTHDKPLYCDITKYDGLIMCLNKDTKHYVIFYNGDLTDTLKYWIISKLLYYIRCGMADENVGVYIPHDCLPEAETFAAHFICPDVILKSCDILNTEDIMEYCHVPFSVAARKARYLKNGYEYFVFPALEKLVKDKFALFIKKSNATS